MKQIQIENFLIQKLLRLPAEINFQMLTFVKTIHIKKFSTEEKSLKHLQIALMLSSMEFCKTLPFFLIPLR